VALAAKSTGKAEDPKDRIARLRQEVASLTVDPVTPAVSDMTAKAQKTMTDATAIIRNQTQSLSARIEQQPLAAVSIGVAAGFLLSRMVR
jgi:anti-sigma factor RsiW